MATTQSMETVAARLETFTAAQAKAKKRASNAKGAKGTKWPHKSPSPAQLAQAGFYFKPTSSSPDNVQCFFCRKDVDGWEAEDDPAKEHVALSPECGWATQIALEQEDESGDLRAGDPMSERMIEARKATFADMWPHERKRGWTCKVQKMVEAGWYYYPTPESDDYAKCAYCGLCLDGWEPKDKPFDEHQRRSPTCAFFASQTAGKASTTRGKKVRTSKAPRMSLQSNATAIIEDQPTADVTMDHGDSILSAATDMSMLSTASKARKPGRPKRGQAKSKTKTTRTKAAEAQASSIVEPEDDDFEIKVPSPAPKSTRGKKRKSEEMQTDTVEHPAAPPPKRATRVRSNTAKPEPTPVQPQEINVTMENADEVVPKSQPKKGAKGTRKRASSTTKKGPARKASTRLASTASKASLRAPMPADEEIEAQLEADLERFSSDGSDNWQVLGKDESEITGLQMPRVRAPLGMVASPINTREGIESSALMSQSAAEIVGESESMIFERTEPILSPPITKKATRAGVKKSKEASPVVASGEQETAEADAVDDADVDMGALEASVDVSIIQTTQEANHEAQSLRTVVQPQGLAAVTQEHINTSQITMTTAADDSGHETDSSILAQKKVKRTSKKGSTKKGKQPKKAALITKKVEITVEVPLTRNNAAQQAEAEEQSIPEEAPDVVVKIKNEKASKCRLSDSHFEPKSIQDEADLKSVKESPALFQERQETIQSVEKVEPENLVEVRIEQPQAPAPIPALSPRRQAPSPTPTPQSSDAENHPPSARPSQIRPPLARYSPTNNRTMRIPLAASTPTGSPSRLTNTKLQTTYPWSAVDLDYMLVGTPNANKENVDTMGIQTGLTSPEKRMSLEEWIKYNAKQGEEKLKTDCEKIVGKFENEGVRALKALEGIVCSD